MLDLVGNPKDRFSHDGAHIQKCMTTCEVAVFEDLGQNCLFIIADLGVNLMGCK